ncbi:carbonic anhydrase [Promicromonospora sp. NPDC060204]|uniref:carbonic anhydrase n=1 Tax=Promicromonospora sp. NPDC060204 TaxID=3347071 RepID=UPI003651AC2B
MTSIETLLERNEAFATERFLPELAINPAGKLMIISCVDPRVDPTYVLGLEQGESAVIRNVGGRVTPATVKTIAMLGKVGQANNGGAPGVGWNLVVLHHTDCGMTDLAAYPDSLAEYFEVPAEELPGKSISDPYGSVQVDTTFLHHAPLPPSFSVSGLVYDVDTGKIETVVPSAPLRAE